MQIGSLNFYKFIIINGLSTAGAKADCVKAECALSTILSEPFLESLEFLEILRRLKFENFITKVRRNFGSATPPSVMALFLSTYNQFYAIMGLFSFVYFCIFGLELRALSF